MARARHLPLFVTPTGDFVMVCTRASLGRSAAWRLIPRTRYARARADERQPAGGGATVTVTDRTVCQHRLTLFSSARLRLSRARTGVRGKSAR